MISLKKGDIVYKVNISSKAKIRHKSDDNGQCGFNFDYEIISGTVIDDYGFSKKKSVYVKWEKFSSYVSILDLFLSYEEAEVALLYYLIELKKKIDREIEVLLETKKQEKGKAS